MSSGFTFTLDLWSFFMAYHVKYENPNFKLSWMAAPTPAQRGSVHL
jgi:hypothetical protein